MHAQHRILRGGNIFKRQIFQGAVKPLTLPRSVPQDRRWLSSSSSDDDSSRSRSPSATAVPVAMEWRKMQLETLEKKFSKPSGVVEVDNDDDLQPMWRQMESRVTNRRPRTVEEMGGRTGRTNVKKTDEEVWLREGFYDDKGTNS